MQRQQRFVADQRFDLPQYDSMLGFISAEFAHYNKNFFAPLNRIVKNWKIVNNGGLQVAVDQSTDSTLFNSERASHEQFILRELTATQLTLNLADNATNFVEVQMVTGTCAADTVAIWDTTANGGLGQEFTQNVDTVTEERPVLVSNTVAFTGAADKIRLATVVTSGGAISSITDARKFLFHVDSDWAFGSPRTDTGIGSFKDAYDALATRLKETNGVSLWTDTTWASNRVLKEYQNMVYYGGGVMSWSGSALTLPAALNIEIAGRAGVYTIAAGTYPVADDQALYVDIPASAGALTPVIVAMSSVPINPATVGFSPNIQVVFFRRGTTLYGTMDMPALEAGETASIGESISTTIQGRLGIINDVSYVAYISTNYITANQSYPDALSTLDSECAVLAGDIAAILADTAKEERFLSTGQTTFTISSFAFSSVNSVPDISVRVNGVVQYLSPDGTSPNGHYKKNSTTQIQFFTSIPNNAEVVIRAERTGGGAGAVDLTNINVNPQPLANGSKTLGTVSKGWGSVFLKDTATTQVYRLDITSGVITATPVP